jgi:hypothetical protein
MATPVLLSATPTVVDLTQPGTATFGSNAQWNWNGLHMLWPGDATANGQIKYVGAANDRDAVLITVGGSTPTATATGYLPTDVNLDGQTKYTGSANDRDLILRSIGGMVPTAVRDEQRP